MAMTAFLAVQAWAAVPIVTWDKHSLIIDGRRVCPVMGEVHYSRIPADEWADEVRKMKEGGVTVVATYVFLYMMQVKGLPTTIALADGKTLRNVKPRGEQTPIYIIMCTC